MSNNDHPIQIPESRIFLNVFICRKYSLFTLPLQNSNSRAVINFYTASILVFHEFLKMTSLNWYDTFSVDCNSAGNSCALVPDTSAHHPLPVPISIFYRLQNPLHLSTWFMVSIFPFTSFL